MNRAMLALGMRTPFQRYVLAVLLAVATTGVLIGQTDVEDLKAKAEQGHAQAQYNLALMYYRGQGVPQDDAEAVKWFRVAAEQGEATAQFNLGFMYLKGQGVPQDYAKAVKWYRLAAEQGHADAQFNLGLMYADGQRVPQDDAEAVKWFRVAAEQGEATAQFSLGLMYDQGQGVPQDYAQALMWANLAESRSSEGEAVEGSAKALREKLAQQMTPEQKAEAQRLARDWKPKPWDELKKGLAAKSR